jgi:hypothetical protein
LDTKEGGVIDKVIGIGGFGVIHGFPVHLITAVRDRGLTDLVVVCNSLGAQPQARTAMRHAERTGQPKIVGECQYPVTGTGCVDLVVTDLAVVERDERGLVIRECAPGFSPDDVRELTGAPLVVELWAEMDDTSRSRHLTWRAEFRQGRRAAA